MDDEDYERVKNMKWCALKGRRTFYAFHWQGKNTISLHRFILNAQPGEACDHIDGNGLNNQQNNLRLATRSQNSMNSQKQSSTASRYKGVSWNGAAKKWQAEIARDDVRYYLGIFVDEIAAARAYDAAAIRLFGEYARLNFTREGELQ